MFLKSVNDSSNWKDNLKLVLPTAELYVRTPKKIKSDDSYKSHFIRGKNRSATHVLA